MAEQIPFATNEFANNPEARCPCVLLLDTSGSMYGEAIKQLNNGLKAFDKELKQDELAMLRVEISIITFGPVRTIVDFISAKDFSPPILQASDLTPMGEAIQRGLKILEDRKGDYRENGINYYRPWIFLITDGEPTDDWKSAARMIHKGETDKKFAFFAVGVQGANMEILNKISHRQALSLDGLKFRELFSWLSHSLRSVSHSTPGDEISLESPKGWALL